MVRKIKLFTERNKLGVGRELVRVKRSSESKMLEIKNTSSNDVLESEREKVSRKNGLEKE